MKYFSPAKLNLFLKIWGERPDNFHELITLYQAIDLGDFLSLENSTEDCLFCNISELASSRNLIWKSLSIFRRETQIIQPVKWRLHKQIPIGSGLGGGSSNAATALYALNEYFETHLPLITLQHWAEEIGSDVPFFFSSGCALGKGRGEKLVSYCQPNPKHKYVIYLNSKGVSTPEAYKKLLPTDFSKRKNKQTFYGENDLEKSVFRFRKDLRNKKLMLERIWSPYHSYVLMSGSGATLFVCYPEQLEEDDQIATDIRIRIKQTQGVPVNCLYRQNLWYIKPFLTCKNKQLKNFVQQK
ncbi:4-(cytidine 5'-diphospho)-2-C-methyl-D-erythritol kinase [Candidatus Chlamydia sanziniae]|uniref:4-diphosphocytidyl-2-C-methyl-D-erythritol kinase n=1 Tax=Candidatus Chlamydia sanziniae TaxID=1806891 RepID=A0A1A9HUT2_9CHLA|nr:4-(cytidine 5'-diphospho)-2-C-methyl-D-erythritol kinase [Candidatus Chlamydia sanziniae]ANH78748.1 4-diphosphocytidyl-2-C-methyl-D-erythritol kinase [Candidatus Chlamydia sanziniae]